MNLCKEMQVQANLLPSVSRSRKTFFVRTAKRVAKLLLTLVHLTGGEPTRGTEPEVSSYVNTTTKLRSFFVTGTELMMVSAHTKMRGELVCITKTVSRHHDKETSFLFKCYVLLVLPVLQFIVIDEEFSHLIGGETNRVQSHVNEPPRISDNDREKLRAILTRPFSVVIRGKGKASMVINDILRSEGFKFSFTDFRQIHSGYAQRRYMATLAAYEALENYNSEILEDESALLQQSNKSVSSALAFYAGQKGICGLKTTATERIDIERLKRASRVYHVDLGLAEDIEGENLMEEAHHELERTANEASKITTTYYLL